MVFCRNCGGDLPSENSSFCPDCGKPQNNANAVRIANQTKSNGTAIVIALIAGILGFNGIGHFYIGKIVRGITLLIVGWILIVMTFFFIPIGIVYLIFWIWQAYDVNNKTKYFNNYIISNGKPPW
jgi:TM2 domain-containing membrane protein YozV